MTNQLTDNAEALSLFFTEDIYLVNDKSQPAFIEPVNETPISTNDVNDIESNVGAKAYEAQKPNLTIVEEENVQQKPKLDFSFVGENQKKILILVNDQQHRVSSQQGSELLRKLIKAIGLTGKDFALVNYANYKTATYTDFINFFASKIVLSFGVDSTQLGLPNQPLHQICNLGDTKVIFTTNLHDLDQDQPSKKILWTSLKQIR